jgi:hypothetical protein
MIKWTEFLRSENMVEDLAEHSQLSDSKGWFLLKDRHHIGPYSEIELKEYLESQEIVPETLAWKQGLTGWKRLDQLEAFSRRPSASLIYEEEKKELPKEIVEEDSNHLKQGLSFKYLVVFFPFILLISLYYLMRDQNYYNTLEQPKLTVGNKQNQLRFSSGEKGRFHLSLRLKSKVGKILGRNQVEILANAIMDKHQASFKTLSFERGTRVIPGYYSYDLVGKEIDERTFWSKFLKKGPKKPREFILKGELLFSSDKEQVFLSKLKTYQKAIIRPLRVKISNWQAFLSVLIKVEALYLSVLKKMDRGKQIALFERQYSETLGPMLQTLLREELQILKSQKRVPEQAKKLFDFGRDFMGIISDMVTKTKAEKIIDIISRKKLSESFLEKIATFKQTSQAEISYLGKKLKSLSGS